MKQINAIIESNERPHILAGGINSLDETDYSPERWTDIVKVHINPFIGSNGPGWAGLTHKHFCLFLKVFINN